jgi:hypothetical protein
VIHRYVPDVGSPILTTARRLKVDHLLRDPRVHRAGHEAGVEREGLG